MTLHPAAVEASIDPKIIYTGPSPRGWHRLQLAAECLSKYAQTYLGPASEEKKGKPSAPLARGTLIHLALAQHYARMRAQQRGENPQEWAHPHEAVKLISALEGTAEHAQTAIQLYDDYVRVYPPEREVRMMRIVAVEELVSTLIKDKYLLTGRLDLAYEDLHGRIWVVDHKSTGRLTKTHRDIYGIHGQLFAYRHMAAKIYGDRFAGLKVNLMQHGGEVDDNGEVGEMKFDRFDLKRAPNMEARFEDIVEDLELLIERYSDRPPEAWPKAFNELTCWTRYGPCPFIHKCQRGPDAGRFGDFGIDISAWGA